MKLNRIAALTLALLTALTLCACGGKPAEKNLRDQGLEVIALMEEMVNSEAYIQFHTGAPGLTEVIDAVAEGVL